MKLTVALVLIEWAAGLLAGLGLVHRLARIGPGFTWLVAGAAAGVALLAAVAGHSEAAPAVPGRTALSGALGVAALAQVSRARRPALALDLTGAALAVAAAGAAGLSAGGGGLSVARALAGALFLGMATDGMVIGHWYLVDTSLPRSVIRRVTVAFLGAVVLEGAALAAPRGMVDQIAHSHRVGFSAVLPGFWVALLLLTALLGVAVLGALRERSYAAVMAATGLLYLAVITAFGVDILAKALIGRSL